MKYLIPFAYLLFLCACPFVGLLFGRWLSERVRPWARDALRSWRLRKELWVMAARYQVFPGQYDSVTREEVLDAFDLQNPVLLTCDQLGDFARLSMRLLASEVKVTEKLSKELMRQGTLAEVVVHVGPPRPVPRALYRAASLELKFRVPAHVKVWVGGHFEGEG